MHILSGKYLGKYNVSPKMGRTTIRPGHGQCGHGVKEAGSKSAKATVTKSCVCFNVLHLFNVQAQLLS